MHQSLHTLFLAQAVGLFLVIVAIIMVARTGYYRDLLTHVKVGSSAIVVASTLGLIIGILLVLVHNLWIWDSEVLVTIFAWCLLIKSIFWLSLPEFMVNLTHKVYSGWGYYAVAVIAGIIGVILMAHGFYPFQGPHA